MVLAQLRYRTQLCHGNQADAAVLFDMQNQGLSVITDAQSSPNGNLPTLESESVPPDTSDQSGWQTVTTQAGRFRLLPDGMTMTVTFTAGATAGSTTIAPVTNASDGGGQQSITFSALGQGQDAQITLQNVQGQQRIITVDALTGDSEIVSQINGQPISNN